MKILFLISEVEDIVKTGGLADVGKALPLALSELGHDVKIILPYYQAAEQAFALSNCIAQQIIFVNGRSYAFDVKSINFNGIEVYFVDYPEYFAHEALYAIDSKVSNAEKFTFFSLAALKSAEAIGFKADILHTNDWHTSMACYFAKHSPLSYEFFAQTKSVLTIHNAAFQGVDKLSNVPSVDQVAPGMYIENGHLNMLKTGLLYADKICPVSPTYAQEISTPLGSHGIDDVIRQRISAVEGVLNGCDYEQWDPATDEYIAAHFSVDDMRGKAACKRDLQKTFKLKVSAKTPVLGMVCRTTLQKGFGYLMPVLESILKHDVQIALVGTGQQDITQQLHAIANAHPNKFVFIEDFKPDYAHKVEAGADFFLMPSEFEPCGLNQMYSLAYGTIPIVRGIGGLKDTITDVDSADGTGFIFYDPSPEALLSVVRKALLLRLEDKKRFAQIITNGMRKKFTWNRAAKEYEAIYKHL
ncbi:glycogen synthase [Glaciecola sp. MH2013]|uniref:glycogen synthase n=1 Tax=Glaciecola sp. MH2013 TaxID=2785524 RepID=UPI00189E0E8A|nr:glycogen synthase [Glaciecola sp. MH2013]MBF7074201.1 glycogen synthase [Glaciecola sp. MH2013]